MHSHYYKNYHPSLIILYHIRFILTFNYESVIEWVEDHMVLCMMHFVMDSHALLKQIIHLLQKTVANKQFLKEIDILSSLKHPDIVCFLGINKQRNIPLLVMEKMWSNLS